MARKRKPSTPKARKLNPEVTIQARQEFVRESFSQPDATGVPLSTRQEEIWNRAKREGALANWTWNERKKVLQFNEDLRANFPAGVLAAYDFYANIVLLRDWGIPYVLTLPAASGTIYWVWVSTDGGERWVEVFDSQGRRLRAGEICEDWIAWGPVEYIRQYVWSSILPELAEHMGYPISPGEAIREAPPSA